MSALPSEQMPDENDARGGETVLAGAPVVVRRRAGLAALIGAGAATVAIAYLWRAAQTMSVLDWVLCAVMAGIAAVHLATFVDSRTPLMVADDLGVRIRLGRQWRGLPWEAVAEVVVTPRRGLLRDGRISFAPRSLARALDGLQGSARRHATLNEKMYGAALAVPLSLTTRLVTTGGRTATEGIAGLTRGRVQVVEPAPEPPKEGLVVDQVQETEPIETTEAEPDPLLLDEPRVPTPRRTLLGGLGTIISRVGKGRRRDIDGGDAEAPAPPAPEMPDALPLRETRRATRAEITHTSPDFDPAPPIEGRELSRPGRVDLVIESPRVSPISALGEPVAPLVVDDFVTEPAVDPVIGPELAASRTRVGLSVDELAERTRIRPHVIESIEVDDFAPCGGDFYARGHLRTLARVLGRDPEPLLETFDNRYATAPVNARRVFEAELATGMTGSMRSTIGGPNWGLLVGTVLVLALVWGVARLFTGAPAELVPGAAPVLNGSAGVDRPPAAAPAAATRSLRMMLVAAHADSNVVVRNGDGKIVFSGPMVLGEKRRLEVRPPVRVRASNAGAIEVVVRGKDRGVLGELDEPGRRTFR